MSKMVLVIVAHPDDEILGCGGTIAKHVRNGDIVNVIILAEGVTSRSKQRDRGKVQDELMGLAKASHKANELLGVNSVILHDYPDNRMDSLELLDVIKMIEGFLEKYNPDVIYTHHESDLNIDHQIVHAAVTTACRPVPGQKVKLLLFFEIPSSSEWSIKSFSPNYFIDISNTLSLKLQALELYHAEMRPWPHPRSIQAVEYLNKWRGSSVGVNAAEAFVLGRKLE